MANWNEEEFKRWRLSRGVASDAARTPAEMDEYMISRRSDELIQNAQAQAAPSNAALAARGRVQERMGQFVGTLIPPSAPIAPPQAPPVPLAMDRFQTARMNLRDDLANPNIRVVNQMTGRSDGPGRELWAAWSTTPADKPGGPVIDTTASEPPRIATGAPPPLTPTGIMTPPASPATPPPMPSAEAANGAPPVRGFENQQSIPQNVSPKDRIALAMLQGSMGTEAIRRYNAIATKYNMTPIPVKPSKAERNRLAAFGGDWRPNGDGGMGNAVTGEINSPMRPDLAEKDRYIKVNERVWDAKTQMFLTPEPTKTTPRGDGTLTDDQGNIIGKPIRKLLERGDGSYMDQGTGEIVGEPTGKDRYQDAGVPGLKFDVVLGATVGKDLRPVKDFVYETKSGKVINLNTNEVLDKGTPIIRDRYQGPVLKITTGKIAVTEVDKNGKDVKTEKPEVGLIGFYDNDKGRYKWEVAEIGRQYSLPGGGVYTVNRATDLSGLEEYKDERPADDQPAGGAPTAPVKIATDEEYKALASGALFTGPDGVERRKP